MNVMLGWLDTLSHGKPIRNPRSTLQIILRNAQVQAKLIEDLLDMNRLSSGNLQIELAPVDVGAMLHTAIQGLQPAADAKGVAVLATVERPGVSAMADGRRLQQPRHGPRGRAARPGQHRDSRHRTRDLARVSAARLRAIPPGRFVDDA